MEEPDFWEKELDSERGLRTEGGLRNETDSEENDSVDSKQQVTKRRDDVTRIIQKIFVWRGENFGLIPF